MRKAIPMTVAALVLADADLTTICPGWALQAGLELARCRAAG